MEAWAALRHLDSFMKYKIGFATLDESGILRVHTLPDPLPPLSGPIHKRFCEKAGTHGCDVTRNRWRSSIHIKLAARIGCPEKITQPGVAYGQTS